MADPYDTEHLLPDLGRRSVHAGLLTGVSQAARFILQSITIVILARLLVPDAFGLVAMASVFTGTANACKDAGLSMATVQCKEINHSQLTALFWINVAISLVLTAVIVAVSPLVAWAYGRPELFAITVILAATCALGGATVQHQALLRRQMRFGSLAVIALVSMTAGSTVSIALAAGGGGYWALVAMPVTSSIANAALVWCMCAWRPGLPFQARFRDVASMVSFGGHLAAANLLNYACRNLDNFLIGVFWGAGPLGLYSKAYQVLLLPITQINAPVSAVMIPALSRMQSDPERFRAFYRRALSFLAVLGMPLVGFAYVAADQVIEVVLGPRWIEAAPVFRALAPAAFLGTISVATGWVTIPLGRTDREFRSTLCGAVAIATSFLIGLPWGILGVATALSVATFSIRVPQLVYVLRGTPVKLRDVLDAIVRPATASLVAGGVVAMLEVPSITGHFLLFALGARALAFALLYAGLIRLLPFGFVCSPSYSGLQTLGLPKRDTTVTA